MSESPSPTPARGQSFAEALLRASDEHEGAHARDALTGLPPEYVHLPEEEVLRRIAARKARFGRDLVILGHHYQQDDVIRFADFTGDSYELSKNAAALGPKYIIFCGVHFMAESADVLTNGQSTVILPDLRAGCTMADMANLRDVVLAWGELEEAGAAHPVPITYMNSSADLKSFVGRHGGAVCTSSNAEKIIRWAFSRGERLLFFPDQHLGRNTAFRMGVPLEQMAVWDPRLKYGGNTPEQLRAAKVILWKGHCSVHQGFTVDHVRFWRAKVPDIRIIVHPECAFEVVQAADESGSTSSIIKTVQGAPAGSKFAVGTEIHLVNRLKKQFEGEKFVTSLSPYQCLCATMYRIRPQYLLYVLDRLSEGEVVNPVKVPPRDIHWSRAALQRMIDISSGQPVSC
ncbi:MAG: Quinolinate synthase A [Myxococcota bacterium]|nr:Quinolinate synthase A [Myxococcota bacterium]